MAPQSQLEKQLAAIWADVLKLEKVGLTDNFFELGGDSIISLQVVSRARLAGVQFTPKELFEHQTVQALAAVARRSTGLVIDQGPVTGSMPLTPVQRRFFAVEIPARHHWNQSVLLRPRAPLDMSTLTTALQALLDHHDALRLRFECTEGDWSAHFAPQQAQAVIWQRALESVEQLHALANEAQRSLSLEHGPMLRVLLVTLPDASQRLFWPSTIWWWMACPGEYCLKTCSRLTRQSTPGSL